LGIFPGGCPLLLRRCLLTLLSCLLSHALAPGAEPHGHVATLQFTSDHQLLCRNITDVQTGGARYPAIAWDRAAGSNAPITHTGSDTTRIEATVTLAVPGLPVDVPYRLEGRSSEPALCFRHEGATPAGEALTAAVMGAQPLGRGVRKVRQAIHWQLVLYPAAPQPQRIALGSTGPHIVYVTLGRPRVSADPRTVVTDVRMEWAVDCVARAQAKRGVDASAPWLVYELMARHSAAYLPTRHYGKELAWKVPETWRMQPPGASCVSIVEHVALVGNMIGLEGELAVTGFCARPDLPRRAVVGGLGDPPVRKQGPAGENWQLFLVDNMNTNKGQVGGRDGMNFYEAALELHWRGERYWYPGGTNHVYDNPDRVLQVFRTLAWAAYDFQLESWVVREVVHTYSRPGDPPPTSCPLPR